MVHVDAATAMLVASTGVVAMWCGGTTDVWPFDGVTMRFSRCRGVAAISLDGRLRQAYRGEPPTAR
jgi:hypothetical protein